MERQQLLELTTRFMDAFNRNDLDTVMSFFAEYAVYDEFNGKQNEGKAAIRAAFTPQFSGAFGKMQFLDEDLFIDAETGKVMASWRCTLEVKGKPTAWRGLDLLHFQGDQLVRKITYAKAKAPLFED
ncbi:MAG TPA: nuclear transport factor 2 family protein [Methylomirabilota bacterium]|jgi:ketosteroid isomerase-like protein|nr:nuclear transport factor 2 family protein [Methylomirabilota bacterium]